MKTLHGFTAVQDGVPVNMELGDDIMGGLIINCPFPIFSSADDAAKAWLNHAACFVDSAIATIVPVTVTMGEPVKTVELKEDEEDDE